MIHIGRLDLTARLVAAARRELVCDALLPQVISDAEAVVLDAAYRREMFFRGLMEAVTRAKRRRVAA